ncbi:hypothetical protein COV15_00830 [Candidatus Woesearchaeota archaeon CG10_big_fil_rev_8_21_14_0_10_34_12]|nr:MAG: hypothetical protein COV15_00830 [Candidatus Woesearchaeota archaeon CG10_big_fil_rev_8_21_14_0_10_34_12]
MIDYLFYTLVLALAFPIGILLAHLCKDELVDFRYWFGRLKFLFVVFGILFLFFSYLMPSLTLTMFFMAVIFAVLEYRGFKLQDSTRHRLED